MGGIIIFALVILILGLLVFVHELGHLIAAKLFGVKVEEFGIGYPPAALSLGKIRETEYTLNWIPFGGFVRLYGDEGALASGSLAGAFVKAPRWKQILILVAGIVMNAVAGWLLFSIAFMIGIPRPVDALPTASANTLAGTHLLIADIVQASPAEVAGIKPGDELLQVMDEKGAQPSALSPSGVREFVSDRGGKKLDVTFLHNRATTTVGVIPANAVIPGQGGRAGIGIDLVLITSTPLPFFEAAHLASVASVNAFTAVAKSVWDIIASVWSKGSGALQGIVGPVGLVSVVGEASRAGIAQVLALAGFISINLAVINLVPIPLLDGGRIIIVLLEGLMRRRAPKLVVHLLNSIGIVSIVLLMVIVTYHDIARLIT
jgi:regulator of sigma E protease